MMFAAAPQPFRWARHVLSDERLEYIMSLSKGKSVRRKFQISYNQVWRPEKLKILSLLDWVRWRPGSLDLRNTLWFLSPRGRCYLGQVVRNFPHCILRWKPRVGSPALMKAYATWI